MFTLIRKPLFVLWFSSFSCLTACDTDLLNTTADEAPVPQLATDLYLIPKGSHYCNNNTLKAVRTAALRFEVTFDASAIYTSTSAANQTDINKLYGVSDCGTLHHTNSARFGWRWYNNRLE